MSRYGQPLFGPGQVVAWAGDYDPAIGGHGTLTASNVVGQGVSHGRAPVFSDLPVDDYPGVVGGAPHAKLAPYGDIYFSFSFSTQFGYYLATRLGVDVTSNSYGASDVDNDGWDAASQEADVIHAGRRTTALFSTGNGAPGFGTVAPPSPSAGIAVGASTQFGGTGWDSIDHADQIVDGDVMVWSNRGPGATGGPGVDLVADGAYSAGDVTLNTILAKDILKSSAEDLGYDALIQGAGSVDAGAAVQAALGARARVSPNEWRVGDYRGAEYPVFSHLIAPGGSDTQQFDLSGPGTWTISDRQLVHRLRDVLGLPPNLSMMYAPPKTLSPRSSKFALHQVGWQGDAFHTPFEVTVGGASVVPAEVAIAASESGEFDVTFTSGLDLDGLVADTFGLSQPSVTTETAQQDDPNDPSSASVKRDVTISNASRLTVSTALNSDDLDLFVVYDASNDGSFTNDEIVGSSATATSNEFVELIRPDDGSYQVWFQGWAVSGTPEFQLTIDAVQGTDLTVSGLPAGPVAAGQPVTLTVGFLKEMTVGQSYVGELVLGPPSAPTALMVPIRITRI